MYYYGIRERRRSFYDSIKQTIAWPLDTGANQQQRPPGAGKGCPPESIYYCSSLPPDIPLKYC